MSAYTAVDLQIDLSPGGWSTFNPYQKAYLGTTALGEGKIARGNVANALLYNGNTQSLIENAIGGSGNDRLIGNQADNVLNGGIGADYMAGGVGNDTYIVDNVSDIVVENAGEGTDVVYSYTLGANLETLSLYGNGNNGYGNALNNNMYGNSGDNILDGGLGADYMAGGAGNDTYVVDNASDIVVENAGEGIDAVYSNLATYTLGANLETLFLYGNGNINGTGNSSNNVMYGNSGNNILDGGAGNDTLYGGAGNDTLKGGLGDDIYIFSVGSGNDTINSYEGSGNNGVNTLQFQSLALSAMSFTKSANDLICAITQTGETIRLSNWMLGANYQVDQFQFFDGTLTATQVSPKIA